MNPELQQIIALITIGAALTWLALRLWRTWSGQRQQKEAGCAACVVQNKPKMASARVTS